MVWKEFDGETTTINLTTSHDDGLTWSRQRSLPDNDSSDHPLLVSDGQKSFFPG